MPFDDRFGLDDDQNLSPIIPDPRQKHPEEPVAPVKLWPLRRTAENSQLLTEGENLCCERNSGIEQRAEK
jgi:hypothetical protein